ncbi:20389_t:CDS:2 [Gigaspora margarita]|uniref:20389_t:CDS:1 n=1 Tax=Gigaspora margarita TaxID=4874 RepID=A0ABN7V6V6_GIGMA|nr:20389_t:CDS:2 [Gigaspora margarita]
MHQNSWWSFPYYSKSNISKQSINSEDNIHPVAEVSEVNSDLQRVMSTYGTSPRSVSAITSDTASVSSVSTFTDTTYNVIFTHEQRSCSNLESIDEQHSNILGIENDSLIKDENVEMKQKRKIRKFIYPNSEEEIIFNQNIFDHTEKRTIYVIKKDPAQNLSQKSTFSTRNSWWSFGGGGGGETKSENVDQITSSSNTITISNKIDDSISETSNMTELKVKPSIDSLKNPTTNDVSSISEERKPFERIKKPSSSETKRRSLLMDWLYRSDSSESTDENEIIKTSDLSDSTSSTQILSKSLPNPKSPLSKSPLSKSPLSKSPPTSSKSPLSKSPPISTTSTPLNDDLPPKSQGSTKSDTSGSSSKKSIPTHHSNKIPSNPLVQTLPANGSSWLHFFVKGPPSRSGLPKINQRSDPKLITDVEFNSQNEGSEMTTIIDTNSSKVSITNESDKKVTKVSVSISNEVDKKITSKVVHTNEVDKKSKVSPTVSPKLKPSMTKPAPISIVLPKFNEFIINKPVKHPDSTAQKALHAINSYLFPPDKPYDGTLNKWLDEITRSTIDVKKIAIIGVHGWFPAKSLRVVVGEPTGTSPKFCDMMAKAVLGYLSKHNISLPSDAITCIPLEGEGTIETREKLLHKNLLYNKTWCEALTLADVVFVATHSQGTPVSTILLSRLIKERIVNPKRQRICQLAMAGISHGPFPSLKDHYIIRYFVGRNPEADATRELFEFMDSESTVAKKYREALNNVISKGVKMVYVASMDDQVLYSGIFTGIDHPSIMRAIYVDGPLYQENDFLIHLIVFAIKLRNAGILDHGLITQLSEDIRGSLYGEGHSTLYNEIDVYTLAVQYLFEVPSLGTSEVKHNKFQAQPKSNPYYLPWSVRGVLEDKNVTRNPRFMNEVTRLKKLYEDWDPPSKILKDLKFRLEPFRDTILGKWKL